jgi:hypothetical protein
MTLNLSGSTGISGVDGSASTPALQGTDANTGIHYPAADTVGISTGGTERLRIDSSARLLVGTSSSLADVPFQSLLQLAKASSDALEQGFASYFLFPGTTAARRPFLNFNRSRGTSLGVNTAVASGDYLGSITFNGTEGTNFLSAADITAQVDSGTISGTSMPGKLVFSTTADGASSPTERFSLQANGVIRTGSLYNRTTAAAANVYVDSGTDLYRSTSSIKYKTDVETLQDDYADAILNVRPVWYRSTCEGDCSEHSWWGFIAEEVAEIDPRLVHWKTKEITYDENGSIVPVSCDPEPEGVAYERFVPHLLNLIKRQGETIAELQAEVAALKAS